jgi:hypothetical protein
MDPSAAVRAAPADTYASVLAPAAEIHLTDRELLGLALLFVVGLAVVWVTRAAFGRLGDAIKRALAVDDPVPPPVWEEAYSDEECAEARAADCPSEPQMERGAEGEDGGSVVLANRRGIG